GNEGIAPLTAAQRLRAQTVPVVTVGFGTEGAGTDARDLAVRELVTPPSVFVKNEMTVRATLTARGYPGQPIEVELYAEGRSLPVASKKVKIPEGAQVVSVSGLSFTPQVPGETKLTLKVKPKEGELVTTNNEYS